MALLFLGSKKSQKVFNNKNTVVGVFITTLLICVVVSLIALAIVLHQVNQDSRANRDAINNEIFVKFEMYEQFVRRAGFAGMIHHFKNAVLRGADEPLYYEKAEKEIQASQELFNKYNSFQLSVTEREAIRDIQKTLDAYAAKLKELPTLHTKKVPLHEIDKEVRINDAPAAMAINVLSNYLSSNLNQQLNVLTDNHKRLMQLKFLSYVLVLTTLFATLIFIAWFRGNRLLQLLGEIRFLSEQLQSGRISHLAKVAGQPDEVGQVARSIMAFQASLDQQQSMMRTIFSSMHDAVFTITVEGFILEVNEAAASMFGYKREALVGNKINKLMPKETADHHDHYLSSYRQTGTETVIGKARELIAQRSDGSTFPIELRVSEVKLNEETVFAGVIRDISARHEREQQITRQHEALQNHAAALERSNQDLEDFAYIASHDLREPLRGLYNYARFVNEDYAEELPKEGQRQLKALMKLSQRMDELVSSLLHYSRLGHQELAIQSVDLNEMINQVIEELSVYLNEEQATVEIVTKLPEVIADHVRLAEVFRNLITNAVKYNEAKKKKIMVGVTEGGTIYVSDNGIGIPKQHAHTIFKMFKRLHARDAYGGGTGSGLTIVKKIIERHHGKIWVEPNVEAPGSTFYFTLNLTNQSKEQRDVA